MNELQVAVRVPAKVNLQLSVGAIGSDGYHPLTTVFHAVSLFDVVTATAAAPGSAISVAVRGEDVRDVPLGPDNLAARAAAALAGELGVAADVSLQISKGIPVAGGMAGGSADAAGALVACAELWGGAAPRELLMQVAARLGSDVPFLLLGGTAIGTGRGDRLTPVLATGRQQWVFATAYEGLATPSVYRRFDELSATAGTPVPDPQVDERVIAALRSGDSSALGAALTNDLQAAAISLRPPLAALIEAGTAAGAHGAVVCGSGPTVAFLVPDVDAAMALTMGLSPSGLCRALRRAEGPVGGARVIGSTAPAS